MFTELKSIQDSIVTGPAVGVKLAVGRGMKEQTPFDQLQERLIQFAARIVRLSDELPKTAIGRQVSVQILRCGTAGAANYAEARGAESRSDFIHKLGIVQKELNETSVWLRILEETNLGKGDLLVAILQENVELAKIITKSIMTARSRAADARTNNGH